MAPSRKSQESERPPPRERRAAPRRKAAGAGKASKSARKQSPRRSLLGRVAMPVVGVIGIGLALLFQPWSEYSPVEMLGALNPRQRIETLRRFDEIFPHRLIPVRAAAAPLDRQEAPLDAIYEWEGERKLVETFLEEANVTGLLVVESGVIVHERYRLGADAETRFAAFSVSKAVVAALIGAAVRDGLIANLDDPAQTYAPQFAGSDYGATSLRHLLAMTAGMEFEEDYAARDSGIVQLFAQVFLLGGNPDRLAARVVRARPAGEAVELASPNTQVLAAVVAAVYGKPFAVVVKDKIWDPFGMASTASWSQNRDGNIGVALGFCCWNATLADIARFGELMRRGGAWGDAHLLPEGWLDEMATPTGVFAEPGGSADLGPWGYGLHAFIPADARGELFFAGEFGQYLWIDRENRTVVAMTAADEGWLDRRAEATEVLRQIVATAIAD